MVKKSLEDVNNKQEKFKSYLCTILKRFTKQVAKLLNFKMIIL